MKNPGDARPKTKSIRWLLAIGGIAALIISGSIVATIWIDQADKSTRTATSESSNANNVARDTRLDTVKQASRDASGQALAGNTAGAIQTLDTAIAATPSSEVASISALYQQKATVAANGGQKDAAVAAQRAAIGLEPTNWRLYEGLGNIYRFIGESSNAVEAYQQADKLLARSPVATDYNSYHPRIAGEIESTRAGHD